MRKITKIRRSVKGISPVISVLLMIAIAVAASLVAYAWVMGYMDFTTTIVGKTIQVQSVSPTAVYVQNIGDSNVVLNALYVNGTLVEATFEPAEIGPSATSTITSGTSWAGASQVTVKIVTTDGISASYTETFP
jgi:flagellin-like protein